MPKMLFSADNGHTWDLEHKPLVNYYYYYYY